MGLKDKLAGYLDPWLCYYCGECSKTCPRDANPGELMMTLRRYLTSVYDWTGFSGRLYKSFKAHLAVVFFLFASVIAAFLILRWDEFRIPLSPDGLVQLNKFAPHEFIATLDHILLLILSFFLLTNILNMFIIQAAMQSCVLGNALLKVKAMRLQSSYMPVWNPQSG
jgi:ferredoxin